MHVSPRVAAGTGRIEVTCPTSTHATTDQISHDNDEAAAVLSKLSFCYPLKLISPRRHFAPRLQCVYMLSYGGGLVAGDEINLSVDVRERASLVLLTQGSTKVFKHRVGRYLTHSPSHELGDGEAGPTRQTLDVRLAPRASLFLLPSPVTCFSRARYVQRQTFELAPDGSSNLVLLDWYTSGRSFMRPTAGADVNSGSSEEWAFDSYESINTVTIAVPGTGKGAFTIAHDALSLHDDPSSGPESSNSGNGYKDRMAPYGVYATVYLFGPSLARVRARLRDAFGRVEQYRQKHPYSLVWSYSDITRYHCFDHDDEEEKDNKDGVRIDGGVARCASVDVESVKAWMDELMGRGGIDELVSADVWKNAFA